MGESFSSAILGNNSPGPDRFNDNRFSFVDVVFSLVVRSSSFSRSCWLFGRHTALVPGRFCDFTTDVFPEEHSGDINEHLLSALRGCKRSGDKARRSNGEPGSAFLGLTNPFFV